MRRQSLPGALERTSIRLYTGSFVSLAAIRRVFYRAEVGGVNSYGNNGVIHIDHAEPRQMAQR